MTSGNSDSSLFLSGAVEMNHFRQFLTGTEGEAVCLFWLDVQHFLHKLHTGELAERDMVTFIKWIRTHYLNEDAPLCLNDEVRRRLTERLCCLHSSVAVVADNSQKYPRGSGITSLSNSHSGHINVITEAQAQVFTSLEGYWLNMYAAISAEKSGPSDMLDNGERAVKRKTVFRCLPDIDAYKSKSAAGCCYHKSEKPPTAKQLVKLPDIHSPAIGKASKVKLATSSLETQPLFTSSTAELFPHSHTPLNDAALAATEDYFHLAPYLSASLRADFLAGNLFLSYLSHNCPNGIAINYLLFWQSAEMIFTADEMRRWYQPNMRRRRVWGRPCNSYHDDFYPTAKTPTELVQLFLMKGAPHMIGLPSHHQERLSMLLPKGLGQSLLISVQEFAAQVNTTNFSFFIDIIEFCVLVAATVFFVEGVFVSRQ